MGRVEIESKMRIPYSFRVHHVFVPHNKATFGTSYSTLSMYELPPILQTLLVNLTWLQALSLLLSTIPMGWESSP